MHPELKNASWILYIWIFMLLWRAVQGEVVAKQRSTHELDLDSERPLRRMKRVEIFEEPESPVGVERRGPDENQAAEYVKPAESDRNSVTDEKNARVLKRILDLIHKSPDPRIHGQPAIQNNPTKPPPLDTGQTSAPRTTPHPLDTIQDVRNTSKVRKSKQNRTETDHPHADMVNGDKVVASGLDKTAVDLQISDHAAQKEKDFLNKKQNDSHSANTPPVDKTGPDVDVKKQNSPLKFVKKQKVVDGNTYHELIGEPSSTNDKDINDDALKVASYEEFVQNAGKKSNKTLRFEKNSDRTGSSKYLDRLNRNHELRQRQEQSLLILQNATKEAEDIQKRLKNHKLKLRSYIDVLKNITSEENQVNKKEAFQKNYTTVVKDKVSNIVNPKKLNRSSQLYEGGGGLKPHFFNKDISETLRARVDMKGLKKSENFWDKKGDDMEDPHMYKHLLDEMRQRDENQELEEEDQLNLTAIAADYAEDDPPLDQSGSDQEERVRSTTRAPTRTDSLHEDVLSGHVDDYQQAKMKEISVTKDTVKARSQHEMFVISQMISARIHGNVLAPPPERCSVRANMKRYRPPEETMKEDDSLFYRVNIKPEAEAAIEGAPLDYLSDYKNPCWLSRITDDKGTLWYDYTESGLTYKRMSFLYEMRLSKESNWRMRCLPYLYFVGVTKSGTTDLYSRLMGHPEIMRPGHKEPMWWNRLTLGMAESLRKPFRYYVDFFDEAAELIRRKVIMKDGKPYHPAITVDATPANLWDYDCWTDIPGNRGLAEPKYTLAHSIKKLVPGAKILMILREPTDRLYSQYRMKSYMEPSATFHKLVLEAIVNFNQCLETRTLRSCAYDYEISKHEFQSPGGVFIRASLYYVFVKDWLDVLPRDQLMIVRTEDYHNDTEGTLGDIFDFLDLSPLSKERLHTLASQKSVNTRADHMERSMEPMLPETQSLLDDFFRPYNKMLAKLLKDKKWKWNDIREEVRKRK